MPTAIDALLECPVFAEAPESVFVSAIQECLAELVKRFPTYADFLRRRGFRSEVPITALEQVKTLPSIFLPVLKSYSFALPKNLPIVVTLTSSGTTGRPSETPLDASSMQRRVQAMSASYRGIGLVSGSMEALCFLIDPRQTQMAGSVVIDAVLRSAPEIRSLTYLAGMGARGPDFDPRKAVAAVADAAQRGPILLVGYPALLAAAMQGFKAGGLKSLPLPTGSSILTGGGWKSFLPGVPLERDEFQQQSADFFQLPRSAIRDMFGLSECPAVFVQCERGNYHTPSCALVRSVDPETGNDVPAGEIGLLELTVPLTISYPLIKILTTDKVTLSRDCPCGRPTHSLHPKGRTTAARFETCAMKMGQAVASKG